jgi:hypothetical protein
VCQNEVLAEMLEQLKTEPDFLNQVITGDSSWFFKYDPETKRQTLEWYTPQSPRHSLHEQIRNQGNGHNFFFILVG